MSVNALARKTQIKFGFLLTYPYLWLCQIGYAEGTHARKTQIKFGFLSTYS